MKGDNGNEKQSSLAIIAGGGVLPFAVADAAIASGRRVILFLIKGVADPARSGGYTHYWLGITQVKTLFACMRKEDCRDIVLIGSLNRPSFWQIVTNLGELVGVLPALISALRRGDNHLLSNVARIAENNGFRIVAAHDVAPEILVAAGSVTTRAPTPGQMESIKHGLELLKALGPFDVGQGVVVINQNIVAVEGIEGTDAMLARVRDLRSAGRITSKWGEGVLIKAPKPQQDRRFDLPTVGPRTVLGVAEAGLAGLAVAAGETLIAEAEEFVRQADRSEVFVIAVEAQA